MKNSRLFCPSVQPPKKVATTRVSGPSFVHLFSEKSLQERPVETAATPFSETKITFERKRIDAREHNLFHIDQIIKERLILQIESVKDMEKELKNLVWILENGSSKDQAMAKKRSTEVRKQIQDLETTFELAFYLFRTTDLLEQYKKTMVSKSSRSFICLDIVQTDRESIEREELITHYLLIAQEYVEIENYKQQTRKLICPACSNLDMRRSGDEETSFFCTECATEVQILDDTPSFKDADRINMCNRYTYSRKGHFVNAMKKHQGKQNTDPETIKSVVKILLETMEFHNLKPINVTKQHLCMFLSETDLSAHYDDLNLLHHIITNEPCPDISKYEAQLLEDFDEQERALDLVYEMDLNDRRINSLNVYYKLYKLLQRCGYTCRKDDFYILKTKTKEDEHDEKLKKAWGILGWRWIETF